MYFKTAAVLGLCALVSGCSGGTALPGLLASASADEAANASSLPVASGEAEDRRRIQAVLDLRKRYLGLPISPVSKR